MLLRRAAPGWLWGERWRESYDCALTDQKHDRCQGKQGVNFVQMVQCISKFLGIMTACQACLVPVDSLAGRLVLLPGLFLEYGEAWHRFHFDFLL